MWSLIGRRTQNIATKNRSSRRVEPRRIKFESLEDRRLLSITVNTLLDEIDGAGVGNISLRDAIAAATSGEVINFSPLLTVNGPATVLLTHGELLINKSLTIDGPGAKLLTIDASGNDHTAANGDGSRVFQINDGLFSVNQTVSISGLTITGGDGGDTPGGGILNTENTSIIACAIVGNSVGNAGGGIASTSSSFLLRDSLVADNYSYGISSSGGGISHTGLGTATIINSTISGNLTTGNGGGIWNGHTNGVGAIVVRSSTIAFNESGLNGGGIVEAGIPGSTPVATSLENSIVALNRTTNNVFANPDVSGQMSVRYSLIRDRGSATIVDNGGNQIGTAAHPINPGIAALADNDGPTKTHALLLDSLAIDAGDPAFSSPPANDQRGNPYVRVYDGDDIPGAQIDIGAFERQAVAPATFVVSTLVDEDDGNYTSGDLSLREAVHLANTREISSDTIEFDPSLTAAGPATIVLTHGEIAISESLTIHGSGANLLTISAAGNDPTPEVKNGDGSRIFNIGQTFLPELEVAISGLTFAAGDSADWGGAILAAGTLLVDSCAFTENAATFPGGHGVTGGGGAIQMTGGSLAITDTRFTNNQALGELSSGGAIASDSANVTMTNSIVEGNSAVLGGGGLYVIFASLHVDGSLVTDNHTQGAAGAIGVFNGDDLSLADSVIDGNTASTDAGGVFAAFNSGPIFLARTTISNNSAGGKGGGVFLFGNSFNDNSRIINSTISGNSAAVGGGAILDSTSIEISGVTLSDNTASANGGGIHLFNADVLFHHATIAGNSAFDFGGGVSIANGVLTLDHTIDADNSARLGPDVAAFFDAQVSATYSLIGSNAESGLTEAPLSVPDANGNRIGGAVNGAIDPKLAELTENGGPIKTRVPLPDSPAINSGDLNAVAGNGTVPQHDTRGLPFDRIYDGRIDIGAVERQPIPPAFYGDYNRDGAVDSADYVSVRKLQGATGLVPYSSADGNGDGRIDQDDIDVWRTHYGTVVPAPMASSGLAVAANTPSIDLESAALEDQSRSAAKSQLGTLNEVAFNSGSVADFAFQAIGESEGGKTMKANSRLSHRVTITTQLKDRFRWFRKRRMETDQRFQPVFHGGLGLDPSSSSADVDGDSSPTGDFVNAIFDAAHEHLMVPCLVRTLA